MASSRSLYPPIQHPNGTWGLDPREANDDPTFRVHRDTMNLRTVPATEYTPQAPVDVREIDALMDRFLYPTRPFGQPRDAWTVREMRTNIAEFFRFMAVLVAHSPSLQANSAFTKDYAELQRAGVGKLSGLHVPYLFRQIGDFLRKYRGEIYGGKEEMRRLNIIRGGAWDSQKAENTVETMNGPLGGSPKANVPGAPRKEAPTMRRRPENWNRETSKKRAFNGAEQPPARKYARNVAGLQQLSAQMIQQALQKEPVNENEEEEEVVTLTNENLQNTTSYIDEMVSLLRAYHPEMGKVQRERDGRRFVINTGRTLQERNLAAQRDFKSLLGYIDRIEQHYVIPGNVGDFVKSVRAFAPFPEQVTESVMQEIATTGLPILEHFAAYSSRRTLMNLGPKPKQGGRRTRKHRRRRRLTRRHR